MEVSIIFHYTETISPDHETGGLMLTFITLIYTSITLSLVLIDFTIYTRNSITGSVECGSYSFESIRDYVDSCTDVRYILS